MKLPRIAKPLRRLSAAALTSIAVLLTADPAAAETSPWYLGVSQSFGYESNVYRISDEQRLSDGQSRSDTISTTSLVGGIDQPIGRQRVYGSIDYGINRFANNDYLNNDSYGLKLALDWETLERLSGTVRVAADQHLTQFNNLNSNTGRVESQKNVANTESINALFRLGRQTRLSFEASLGYRQRSYSADGYADEEFTETTGSLGVRYRPSSLLDLGASIRQAIADYPNFYRAGLYADRSETRTRQYIDFTANWVPNGLSRVYLRISPTRMSYEKNPVTDFSGLTGSADWYWQATGKTRLHTTLWRDAGESADAFDLGIYGPGVNDSSMVTTALRVRADHELTGKIGLYASLTYAHRLLDRSVVVLPALTLSTIEGSDDTTSAALGVNWAVTRAGQLGCEIRNERRSVSNPLLSAPFDGYAFSCYGQIVIR